MERLSALAQTWMDYGITPERSAVIPVAVPFVGVKLPHLTTWHRWLWIKFFDFDEGFTQQSELAGSSGGTRKPTTR